jgi:cytoskeleton protein RodZ
MSGFGERLRRERELRGVTLDEIAESTKIGTRSLRALEDEDFEKLPGGIFNKGFVRAFARFLGIDEDEAVSDFEAAFSAHIAAQERRQAELNPPPPPSHAANPWSYAAVGAAVVLAAGGWLLHARHDVPRNASRSTVVASPMPPPKSKATTPPPPASPTNSHQPSAKSSDLPDAAPTQIPDVSSPQPKQTANAASTENTTSPRSTAAAAIRLELVAHEDSWISVLADGRNLGQQILAAQQRKSIQAEREIRVKLGNVAGVEVSFNGRPVNVDGTPKQVKELTFTADGLRQ